MAARMSVELPLWRALAAYRLLTMAYAVGLYVHSYGALLHPLPAGCYIALLALWTLATLGRVRDAAHCTRPFLAADLTVAVGGVLLTGLVDTPHRIAAGAFTLPSIWTAGPVLAFALKGGWRWAALASTVVAAADLAERGTPSHDTVHNVILVWVAGVAIGYVIEVARASERTLARALQIEAATRERERLARDIHDGVLQVLAMVQRRGRQAGGEAAELGRLAGEQEAALRSLITGAPAVRPAGPSPGRGTAAVPGQPGGPPAGPAPEAAGDTPPGSTSGPADTTAAGAHPAGYAGPGTVGASDAAQGGSGAAMTSPDSTAGSHGTAANAADGQGTWDLGAVLGGWAGPLVTVSAPGTPVPLAAHAAAEVSAAVGAALDNVRAHAGERARAWILVEDEPGAIVVTVRDDGPGIADGRLAAAEAEGRLGVAQSIRGRLRDLGGTADLVSVPGQGTEVELRLPRAAPAAAGPGAAARASAARTPVARTALVAGALRALGAVRRPRGKRTGVAAGTGAGSAPAAAPRTGADPAGQAATGAGTGVPGTGPSAGTGVPGRSTGPDVGAGPDTTTTTSTNTGTGGRGTR